MDLCKHLIPFQTCDVCRPRPAAPLRPAFRPGLGPWFEAQYDGDCDGCGDEIIAGDQIRSDGEDGWLCGTCGGEDEEPAEPVRYIQDVQLPGWEPAPVTGTAGTGLAAFLAQQQEG